jgi:hypothetical protein
LNNYAQGTASSNYQNVFNNAFTQYQSAYNTFRNNQSDQYSRLMGLSGEGLNAAGGAGNLIQGIGGDIASLYAQQGAAKAGGTIGSANSLSGILPGIGSALGSYGALKSLNGSNTNTPFFGSLSPTQISGAYGGPGQVPLGSLDGSASWQQSPSYLSN